ncbi:MAG: hypothetical protein Q9165_008668 [Trypethelium subeluteriae]
MEDSNGTELSEAAFHGNTSQVREILQRQTALPLAPDRDVEASSRTQFHNALQTALLYGHADVARLMVQHLGDANAQDGHFGNAIQAAAFGGNVEMINLALLYGADVNAEGRFGTALRIASLKGHDTAVHLLLDKGAVLNIFPRRGNAVETAASAGNQDTTRVLLRRLELMKHAEGYYRTALAGAAYHGHEGIVKDILRSQFIYQRVVQRIKERYSSASAYEDIPEDAFSEIRDEESSHVSFSQTEFSMSSQSCAACARQALQNALIGSHEDIASLLLRYIYGESSIPPETSYSGLRTIGTAVALRPGDLKQNHYASLVPAIEVFTYDEAVAPRERKFDIKQTTRFEDAREDCFWRRDPHRAGYLMAGRGSLLRLAAWRGLLSICKDLLDRGVDIDADVDPGNNITSNKPTALEIAVTEGHADIVSLLLERGSKLRRALAFAACFRRGDIIDIIMESRPGAMVDIDLRQDPHLFGKKYGQYYKKRLVPQSPLAIAVEWGHQDIVDKFLGHMYANKLLYPSVAIAIAGGLDSDSLLSLLQALHYTQSLNDSDGDEIRKEVCSQAAKEAAANGQLRAINTLVENCGSRSLQRDLLLESTREAARHHPQDVLLKLAPLAHSLELCPDFWGAAVAGVVSRKLKPPRMRHKNWDEDSSRKFALQCKQEQDFLQNLIEHPLCSSCGHNSDTNYLREAIHEACGSHNADGLDLIMRQDLTGSMLRGASTYDLHCAISKNGSDLPRIVKLLIDHGAEVNAYDDKGRPPLYYAAVIGNPNIFEMLVNAGADAKVLVSTDVSDCKRYLEETSHGATADKESIKTVDLLQVVLDNQWLFWGEHGLPGRKDRREIAFFLFHLGLKVDVSDESVITFAAFACADGEKSCVESLLAQGVDPNARTDPTWHHKDKDLTGTLLHVAAFARKRDMVDLLLDKGADPCAMALTGKYIFNNVKERTPMATAIGGLSKYPENDQSLFYESHKARFHVVERLAEASVSIDDLERAFRFAVVGGRVELVHRLLQRGVSISKVNSQRHRPGTLLQLALGHDTVFEMLLQNGAKIDDPPDQIEQMMRRLMHKHRVQREDVLEGEDRDIANMKQLLSRGDVHMSDEKLNDLAFEALQYKRYKAFEVLKCTSFDINVVKVVASVIPGPNRFPPYNLLSRAVAGFDREAEHVRYVLEQGADPDLPGLPCTALVQLFPLDQGCSAQMLLPIVKLLLEAGVDVNKVKELEDKESWQTYGKSPLWRMVAQDQLPVVEMLIDAGADVNADTGFGTPLALARKKGNKEMANFLVRKGAVHNAEDAWVEV